MSKITKAAMGQECMVRIPLVCNFNTATTVHAHYRMAGMNGTGLKPPDFMGAWACSACHDEIDGRTRVLTDRQLVRLFHAEGVFRTQLQLSLMGLLK